ncbi:Asparagine synthase [Carnobacterium iners]|uniref:asparagine synthase (glutamine-hydrolyzing) n=1 Tax=Carnobacterium iners TaxID=1073423 RepID=A0A1X7N8Q8_9LACT|nr:asparagine synthase-related protein [Carnobacterium iners]SEL20242.1 Asparagine synthase [Carnobacterium iners]SMH33909.1 Asparagine synthase [Carnobacterium iners]
MNVADNMKNILEEYPNYQETLFTKGYLITSNLFKELDLYPFYNNWNKEECGTFNNGMPVNIYYHKQQDYHVYEENGITAAIIGHAYNPFDMKYKEVEILKDCIQEYKKNEEAFLEKISELTGIHIIVINDNGNLIVLQDCAGMKACYYGIAKDDVCITSHPQLVGDIYNLEIDANVNELMQKWFFSLTGRYLPGDLSPYKLLKRLGPNTLIRYSEDFKLERFYPTERHPELSEDEYEESLNLIAKVLKNNIELCTLKWDVPAISLSGGMDSKTTLASANGFYDKYKYYSFHSKPQEIEDADAAHEICREIRVEHDIYAIPERNEDIQDFEILKKIILHNASYIDNPKDNEIRKFIYLSRLNDFDVELKSWVSEIGRAMWGKKYSVSLPETLTPRHFTIFQTRYFGSPKLLRHSDRSYEDYLQRINLTQPIYNYEHADLFYWEFRFGSWGSNVATTQDISRHMVTMPMNNRKLMDMFLWFPHEYRKKDMVNRKVIKISNNEIAKLDINVDNMYLRGKRVFIEKIYYHYRTFFYRSK